MLDHVHRTGHRRVTRSKHSRRRRETGPGGAPAAAVSDSRNAPAPPLNYRTPLGVRGWWTRVEGGVGWRRVARGAWCLGLGAGRTLADPTPPPRSDPPAQIRPLHPDPTLQRRSVPSTQIQPGAADPTRDRRLDPWTQIRPVTAEPPRRSGPGTSTTTRRPGPTTRKSAPVPQIRPAPRGLIAEQPGRIWVEGSDLDCRRGAAPLASCDLGGSRLGPGRRPSCTGRGAGSASVRPPHAAPTQNRPAPTDPPLLTADVRPTSGSDVEKRVGFAEAGGPPAQQPGRQRSAAPLRRQRRQRRQPPARRRSWWCLPRGACGPRGPARPPRAQPRPRTRRRCRDARPARGAPRSRPGSSGSAASR
ncbi:hypothetical protein EV139_2782 [Leucobacter luti]|uniref:Uncharacterized protein n=1 Tax=Leucobacter luti TaxID=340320 RepID=A0A4Q7TK91_9MICO|nr:hypothetical protein EV139_2782 [Leucobacter luti]